MPEQSPHLPVLMNVGGQATFAAKSIAGATSIPILPLGKIGDYIIGWATESYLGIAFKLAEGEKDKTSPLKRIAVLGMAVYQHDKARSLFFERAKIDIVDDRALIIPMKEDAGDHLVGSDQHTYLVDPRLIAARLACIRGETETLSLVARNESTVLVKSRGVSDGVEIDVVIAELNGGNSKRRFVRVAVGGDIYVAELGGVSSRSGFTVKYLAKVLANSSLFDYSNDPSKLRREVQRAAQATREQVTPRHTAAM